MLTFQLDSPSEGKEESVSCSIHRVLVVGGHVESVQQVSRSCLSQGWDTLPYYGFPTPDAVALFNPHLWILCWPVPDLFVHSIAQPYWIWGDLSAQEGGVEAECFSTLYRLEERLGQLKQRLTQAA